MLVGITGTPGTGKKSVSPLAANALGLQSVSINDLARRSGLLDSGPDGEVDVRKLKTVLAKSLHRPALVYGHLLPQVFGPDSMAKVVVLRSDPVVLKKRLEERGYALDKVIANVEAELIGLVSSEAYETFGWSRTVEVDTSRTSDSEAARLVTTAIKEEPTHDKRIDWTLNYDSARKLRSLLSAGTGKSGFT
ncbi:MAG TPA: AAA family ATPase [Nitrososphaerales archaeon]|nr:AAA family ATPase [Nitrososphaerales archaeon]